MAYSKIFENQDSLDSRIGDFLNQNPAKYRGRSLPRHSSSELLKAIPALHILLSGLTIQSANILPGLL